MIFFVGAKIACLYANLLLSIHLESNESKDKKRIIESILIRRIDLERLNTVVPHWVTRG